MNSRFFALSLSLILITLPSCAPEHRRTLQKRVVFTPKNIQTTLEVTATVEQTPTISIWIHGTRFFFSADILRYFHFTKPGMHRACEYEPRYHVHQVGKTLVSTAPHLFSNDLFYIFGWSGKLDFGVREKTAEHLYKDIMAVSATYEKEHGIKPKVRLITHSHGGNVALNLARIPSKDPNFAIDELILLACPVQNHTASLISDPIFKKIFCIYSQLDIFQILDPQGLYKNSNASSILSGRYFPEQDNLQQVKIKMNGRAIFHSEFVFPRFLSFLPEILSSMENWHQEIANEKPFAKFMKMLHVRTDGKPFRFTREKPHPIVT